MACHGGPNLVEDNLVLYVDAANTKSYPGTGTAWNDISGSGNNGTLTNGTAWITARGGAFSFDGTNDYVGFPQINFAGTEITAAIWIFGVNNNASSVIYFDNAAGNRVLNVHIPWSNNRVYFDKGGSSYDRIDKAVTNAEYQGWHHWVFTANSSTGSMKIYNDGVLWHSGTGKTNAMGNADGSMRVLGKDNSSNEWTGYMTTFQLYTNELSAAEVKQNFDATKRRHGL